MKRFIPLVIGVLFVIVGLVVSGNIENKHISEYKELYAQYEQLQSDIATKKAEVESQSNNITQVVTGLDEQRHNHDDESMVSFFNYVLNWHNFDEFCAARDEVKEKYNPDDEFMHLFFPDIQTAVSPDGHVYNYIDINNLTMEYSDMQSYIINIDGDEYTYFAIITIQSVTNGNLGQNTIAMRYTIDADSKIVNIKGIL